MLYFYSEMLFIFNKFKYLIYIATIMFYVYNIVIVDLALLLVRVRIRGGGRGRVRVRVSSLSKLLSACMGTAEVFVGRDKL